MNNTISVCIIIPMYNEEKGARDCLSVVVPYLRELPGHTTVLVVNDGSTDATQEEIDRFIASGHQSEIQCLTRAVNGGYGAALRSGIQFAIDRHEDYVVIMDSDLTNHPRYLKDFYAKMEEGWDYIKATRYSKGGRVEGVPWQRRLISWLGNKIARPAFRLPIYDFTNGFRAIKVDILRQMTLTEKKFPIIVEELCEAKKYARTFCEIPYVLTSRTTKHGVTSFSYDWKTYRAYLSYVVKAFFIPTRK